jgi:hypothetical protein
MNNFEIKRKAHQLVSDLIDSAIVGGWEVSENDEEAELIEKEIRNIEKELRKIAKFNYNKWRKNEP